MLFSLKLCILNEKRFPYIFKNQRHYEKFNWISFYNKLETMNLIQLATEI